MSNLSHPLEKYLIPAFGRGPVVPEGLYLSPVVLLVRFKVSVAQADDMLVKAEVRRAMRVIMSEVLRHGIHCPAVALLEPSAHDVGGEVAITEKLGHLVSDHEWHQGEFLVFVESSANAAAERSQDLLAPDPPKVHLALRRQWLGEVIETCSGATTNNPTLQALIAAWSSELDDAQRSRREEAETEARCSNVGTRKLEELVAGVRSKALQILNEVAGL